MLRNATTLYDETARKKENALRTRISVGMRQWIRIGTLNEDDTPAFARELAEAVAVGFAKYDSRRAGQAYG